jgi:hypothetical protein
VTAPTTVLKAPAGVTQFVSSDGTAYLVSAAGEVTIPFANILEALIQGFLLSAVEPGSITDAMIATAAAIAISKIANPVPKLLNDRVLGPTALGIGSTDTRVANGAFLFQIGAAAAGVNTFKSKGAVAAGTALGALGTVPASKWAILLPQIAADGTVTYKSGAANYTTGYASEAAAIAAVPTADAAHAPMGYVTLLASASTWIAGTDAFAGGASGNPATTTHYFDAGLNF